MVKAALVVPVAALMEPATDLSPIILFLISYWYHYLLFYIAHLHYSFGH